jgi:hypothetical protein
MINFKEYLAYVDYLFEFNPTLPIVSIDRNSNSTDISNMMFKAGVALGKTVKYLKENNIKKEPLVLDSFLSMYRRDSKISDIID